MEMRKENGGEKRRRRIISKGPVLIRSVKPSQMDSATYSRESSASASTSFWKN
jgi:hypothetical protein